MVEVDEKAALLDKAVFNNIRIREIYNPERLARMGVLELNACSQVNYITESGQEFTKLHIKEDGSIDLMVAGTGVHGNTRADYCQLSTSVKGREARNLTCYTVEDYRKQLEQIQDQLVCCYGLDTDFSAVKLKELEINRTFRIDGAFDDYYRPLILIMNNLPSAFRHQMRFLDEPCEPGTYYATTGKTSGSSRCMLLKIYDKSKSVEKTITLEENYMRVEIRLMGAQKIQRALGTNRFNELTDEMINDFFDKQMRKLIVNPYQSWKKKRDKELVALMKQQLEADEKHWIVNVLRKLQNEEIEKRVPVLLDISELTGLLKAVIGDRKQRYRVKQSFCRQAAKYETAFCNGDADRLAEIIGKVLPASP